MMTEHREFGNLDDYYAQLQRWPWQSSTLIMTNRSNGVWSVSLSGKSGGPESITVWGVHDLSNRRSKTIQQLLLC